MASKKTVGRMILPSVSAAALWEDEIVGQISDGMWENSSPHNHWQPWLKLELWVIAGAEPKVDAETTFFPKVNYALSRLFNIGTSSEPDYCIRDRMIQKGRMGAAIESLGRPHLSAAIAAAEHMPAIFEEWIAAKESGAWNSAYLKQHMAIIDLELARAYYDRNESYGLKEMKADVAKIKAAMMSAKHF